MSLVKTHKYVIISTTALCLTFHFKRIWTTHDSFLHMLYYRSFIAWSYRLTHTSYNYYVEMKEIDTGGKHTGAETQENYSHRIMKLLPRRRGLHL
jgi:hypothetical protein